MYSLFYLLWPICLLINTYTYRIPDKVFKNVLSFAHSISVVVLTSLFIYSDFSNIFILDFLYYFSQSYYIYDSLQIFISGNVSSDKMLIIHHVLAMLTITGLYTSPLALAPAYNVIEISNFFNYIVYHMLKTNYCEIKIFIMKLIQLIWVYYFRIYSIGIMLLIHMSDLNYYVLIPGSVIYIMGFFWWGKQCRSFYYEIKKIKSD